MIENAEFFVNSSLRPAPFQLVARPQVDKPGVTGQARVPLGDPAEHFLGHPPVVGMALRSGPQLAEVIHLAEVGPEVPADAESERDDVLGQGRAGVALEPWMDSCRGLDSGPRAVGQAAVFQPWRQV